MKNTIKYIIPILVFSSNAIADASIELHGSIIEAIPICSINTTNHIPVDFGDKITTKKIIANAYIEKIEVDVSCTNPVQKNMSMIIRGDPAEFNSTLIKTSTEGLGIKILRDNTQVNQGSSIKFTYDSASTNGGAPEIYATLVAKDNTLLKDGPFDGTAYILFQYN